jgi:hypothetical protein
MLGKQAAADLNMTDQGMRNVMTIPLQSTARKNNHVNHRL